jgi:hypothetical protein
LSNKLVTHISLFSQKLPYISVKNTKIKLKWLSGLLKEAGERKK